MNNRKSFAQTIQDRRGELLLTQKQLADACSCSFTYISKLENGTWAQPSRKMVLALAEALELDAEELLITACIIDWPALRQVAQNNEDASAILSAIQTGSLHPETLRAMHSLCHYATNTGKED